MSTAVVKNEIQLKIKLANPRGFCAGVDRAIDIVNRALDIYGAPIYVRHEVVHNKLVVENLKERGAVFVNELSDVPINLNNAPPIVIFSAHGVSLAIKEEASNLGMTIFDATCPLVTKVHNQVIRYSQEGYECILIGHAFHPEVQGTMGQYHESPGCKIYLVESKEDVLNLKINNPAKLAYVTQTTLSLSDTSLIIKSLIKRFPKILGPRKKDICYATQNRQDAVKQLALECDLVLVVGSPNSSNSNRLKELAERMGIEAYLIDNADEINKHWLEGKSQVGVTAGASAPEELVAEVIRHIQGLGGGPLEELVGTKENITFSMPRSLRTI